MYVNKNQTGITLGIPTLGRQVPLEWAFAFKAMNPPINFNMEHIVIQGKPVAEARNAIATHALQRNHKYVYFMGDDTIPPHNILRQLIYRAEQNKNHGVITGVYCSKSEPAAPLVFRGNGVGSYWDWRVGEYFEITGCGMDAVLIRTDVFRELIPHVGKDKNGSFEFFKTIDTNDFEAGINNATMWTEDLYFLDLVEKFSSFKIFCDGSMLCDHFEPSTGKVYRLPHDSFPVTGVNEFKVSGKRAIDIGCGEPPHINLGEGIHVTRCDIRDECRPDFRVDVRNLPFADGYFDIVFSSHVLEHFSRLECLDVLDEWVRVLKPEGELRLILPNINWAVEQFKAGVAFEPDIRPHVWNVLYGAQSNPYDYHYNGWTEQTLKAELERRGFTDFRWIGNGYNMLCRAFRSEQKVLEEWNPWSK